jgi:hypothetical protein
MTRPWLAGLVVVPFLLGAAAAPVSESRVAFRFQDNEIIESSGLAVVDGLVVTVNDSGDAGRIFTVDPATGETVGTTGWGDGPQDVEALAPMSDTEVWVGDIGDNLESRDAIEVAPVPVGPGSSDVDAPVFRLVYPDGPHDAETLLADPGTGRLYVATKGVLGGRLYAAPETLDPRGPNRLEPLGDVLPIATDGAFFPDGKHLVIRSYSVAEVYAFPSLEKVGSFPLPSQPQGEGLAIESPDTLLLSSEGLHAKVLRVTLPDDVRAALAPATSPSSAASTTVTTTESREDSELRVAAAGVAVVPDRPARHRVHPGADALPQPAVMTSSTCVAGCPTKVGR